MLDITRMVASAVTESAIDDGLALVYVPHTTAAITTNEGADPDVIEDVLSFLEEIVPYNHNYRHFEGNSDAHIKSLLVGVSQTIIVDKGKLNLGTWQKVFFCEFDGPRKRHFFVKTQKS